jgi:hypothetical protein
MTGRLLNSYFKRRTLMSDSRMYPEGSGGTKSRYINGIEVIFGMAKAFRTRVTTAQVNAGFDLLAALPGVRWRLLDAAMIAIGGAATSNTSVNISGIRAGSAVQLLAVAIAALTQSALVRAGAANAVILADGASFTQLDANTAMRATNVGASMTVATNIDFLVHYVADQA